MHGIKTNILTTGTRPITALSTAVIGLIATASAAAGQDATDLNAAFPLDTPVLVTDVRKAAGEAGTGGTLGPALAAIADEASATVVVVRVAIDADVADQNALVIGAYAAGAYTGMQALLTAESRGMPRPAILGAPGLDTTAVATGFASVAAKLDAMAYVAGAGADRDAAIASADTLDARELMPIWPGTSAAFTGDAVARALGLRARIDQEQGWHKTLSNVPLRGVTGLSDPVTFAIDDDNHDAALLNAAQITTLVNLGGYRFWGNRTTASEPLWSFESAVRTSQALKREIAQGLIWAIDKPLTQGLIKDIVETINARFRALKAQGRIIGGHAWYDPAQNDATDLAAGKLVIDYDFTPAAPLEGLTLNQRLTDRYYAEFTQLAA